MATRGTYTVGFGLAIYRPTLAEELEWKAAMSDAQLSPRVERCAFGRATVYAAPGQDCAEQLRPWGTGWVELSRERHGSLDRVELARP